MTTDRSKIIDRINNLRAGQGRTEAEAATFIAKAMEMMAEHQITEAELRTGERAEVGRQVERWFFGNANQGIFSLVCAVAPVFDCAAIGWVGEALDRSEYPAKWRRACQMTIFGTEDDRAMLLAFLDGVLLPQLVMAMGRDRPKSRASYSIAWAFEVADRIATERRRVFDRAGVALIPFDEPKAMAEAAADAPPVEAKIPDRASAVAGLKAGQTADIGSPAITPTDRPGLAAPARQLNPTNPTKETTR